MYLIKVHYNCHLLWLNNNTATDLLLCWNTQKLLWTSVFDSPIWPWHHNERQQPSGDGVSSLLFQCFRLKLAHSTLESQNGHWYIKDLLNLFTDPRIVLFSFSANLQSRRNRVAWETSRIFLHLSECVNRISTFVLQINANAANTSRTWYEFFISSKHKFSTVCCWLSLEIKHSILPLVWQKKSKLIAGYQIKITTQPPVIAKSFVKNGSGIVLLHVWLLNTNTCMFIERHLIKAQDLLAMATMIKTVSRHLKTMWSKSQVNNF